MLVNSRMESPIKITDDIVVVNQLHNYKFYYKPSPNIFTKKGTRKQPKYTCYLHVGVISRLPPQHIKIHDFDCNGRGKGSGKLLLCAALNYLKSELGLKDDAVVSLTALSTELTNPRKSQDKLIAYYNKTYGLEVIKEDMVCDMFRTDMSTNIKTMIDKCAGAVKENKSMRKSIGNFALAFKRRCANMLSCVPI